MPNRNSQPYPINAAVRVYGSIEQIPEGWTEQSISDAIDHVTGKFKSDKLKTFVRLRYQENKTYKEIASEMGYAGPERPRQLDIKFNNHMHSPEAKSIVANGITGSKEFINDAGGKWEVGIKDIGLDIRSYNCFVRYFTGWRVDTRLTVDEIKAKHIVKLFAGDELYKIRNLGKKTLWNSVIPRLKELGFTDDELHLKKGAYSNE